MIKPANLPTPDDPPAVKIYIYIYIHRESFECGKYLDQCVESEQTHFIRIIIRKINRLKGKRTQKYNNLGIQVEQTASYMFYYNLMPNEWKKKKNVRSK